MHRAEARRVILWAGRAKSRCRAAVHWSVRRGAVGAGARGCGRRCHGVVPGWFEYFAKIGQDVGLGPFTGMRSGANVVAGIRVPAGWGNGAWFDP